MKEVYVIKYQDGEYQYAEDGTPIAEWNEKACNWVFLPEYEDCDIKYDTDEYGLCELPHACKRCELPEGWEDMPDFTLEIIYVEHEGEEVQHEYRSWGYMDYTAEEAKEELLDMYRRMLSDYYSVAFKLYKDGELIYEGK